MSGTWLDQTSAFKFDNGRVAVFDDNAEVLTIYPTETDYNGETNATNVPYAFIRELNDLKPTLKGV